jgi:hypothetical protein
MSALSVGTDGLTRKIVAENHQDIRLRLLSPCSFTLIEKRKGQYGQHKGSGERHWLAILSSSSSRQICKDSDRQACSLQLVREVDLSFIINKKTPS